MGAWVALAVFALFVAVAHRARPLTRSRRRARRVARAPRRLSPSARARCSVQRRRPTCCCTPRWRPPGSPSSGTAHPANVGWFAVCLLGVWCALIGGRRDGLVYWAGALALFAVEWLWVQPDPGWGAWMAGITLTVLGGLLIRRRARPRRAAAGGPGRAGRAGPGRGAQPHRPRAARRHRAHADGVAAARHQRAAGGRARPGRRGACAGRGRAAGPGEPGRGAAGRRDAASGRR